MCGIFGILHSRVVQFDPAVLEDAARVQAHRGPDCCRVESFALERTTLLFAHQRLSIIDLTDAAHQPMAYPDGQGSLIYNGELYNYLELRSELASAGARFVTRSDTEVLLTALHYWGGASALRRFNWMGAFAWYDRTHGKLLLACDAGSEKPLYYYHDGETFAFASEVKTLLTLLRRKFPLDRDTIGQFIFQGLSDASPQTFFQGIRRLEAGTYMEMDVADVPGALTSAHYVPPQHPDDPATMSLPDFIEQLRCTFLDSVRLRLRSDVPVGVLLSGGVDSSSIAAATQMLTGRDVAPSLLCAVSNDARFDESSHMEAMERHLGQAAHKVILRTTPENVLADLSTINWYNDAPVAGLSALAYYRLMERAKQLGLTVILSGQGADEILLGYRKFLGFYLQALGRRGRLLKAAAVLARFLTNGTVVSQFSLADAKRYLPFVRTLTKAFARSEGTSIEGPWLRGWRSLPLGLGAGTLADRQAMDIKHYSVPSLCHYEDRMSMAMSREVRLPFLDSRLVDLLLRAPDSYKLRDGWTKYAFRKAMEPLLPQEIAWRKDKKGFSNPQGEWLKRELRGSVRDAFSADSLINRKGIVDSSALRRRYDEYCAQPVDGGLIWYREIFAPFSLELWMRRYEAWIE